MELKIRLFEQRGAAVDAQVKPAENGEFPATPPALLRQKDWLFPQLAILMRTYGIERCELQLANAGVMPAASVAFRSIDDKALPPELHTARPDIVRILRLFFERLCVSSFEIVLTAGEKDELRTYWQYLASGDPELLERLRAANGLQTPTPDGPSGEPPAAETQDRPNAKPQNEGAKLQPPEFKSDPQG